MRMLFVITGRAWGLERLLDELGSRGHRAHVALREAPPEFLEQIDRVCRRHPAITRGVAPMREDRWVALANVLGLGVDYLRYLSPEYADAPKLRARGAQLAPSKVVRVAGWPVVRTQRGIRLLARVMRLVEGAIPDSREVRDLLLSQRPDLVLVSPLVKSTVLQADYLRAARSLGIRSGVLVRSWDNLTNKGLIRNIPDRVYVWNEEQRREAIDLHGVPGEQVVATGAYPWDHWFGWEPSTTAEQFRQRLGFRLDRPMLLYVGSSGAPDEASFVERWLEALRGDPDQRLGSASVLIRPHPGRRRYDFNHSAVAQMPGVVVWPMPETVSRDTKSNSDYFDSIYHSSAVVGLNTSALIEAAIVGRPVFTVLAPEYRDTQQGTLHFRHLLRDNGGPLTVAHDFAEHFAHLAKALTDGPPAEEADREFVRRFVRPHGLDRPAEEVLLQAIEDQLASPPPPPAPARVRRAIAAILLRTLAALAARGARPNTSPAEEAHDPRAAPPVTAATVLGHLAWGYRAAGKTRRQLRGGGLDEVRLPRAPSGPAAAERGLSLGLRLSRASCLVGAVVRQRWHASNGRRRAIVVGVTLPSNGFQAHAWLEGDPPCQHETYHELLRYPAT
jgi:transglutaminase superfamily protein